MARTVIGGLLSSTLITLVFVPVVYSIFERLKPAATISGKIETANSTS
jgi:HAE1 family hydrophobic/amphiphilic exporter-1